MTQVVTDAGPPGGGPDDADGLGRVVGAAREAAAAHGRMLVEIAGLVRDREALFESERAARARELAEGHARLGRTGPPPRPFGPPPAEEAMGQVATELGLELRLAPGEAEALVADAQTLDEHLPVTKAALLAGRVSRAHAEAIVTGAGRLVDRSTHAGTLDACLVGYAAGHTPRQTRREAERLIAALEPEATAERERRARERRGVRFDPAEDAMGRVTLDLPAEAMTVLRRMIRAAVAAAKRVPDETRSARQLAVDLIAAWAVTALSVGHALPGHCPGCTCDRPAHGPEADQGRGPGHASAEDTPSAACSCGGNPGLGRLPGREPVLVLDVTVAASTLTGQSDLPGDLRGHGAVSADWIRQALARWLAQGGRIRGRIIPVDATGRPVTPVQEKDITYSPSASTARSVRTRDRTCRVAGCARPAEYADLDHSIPWDGSPEGAGPTHPANLAVLCRHHHGQKTRRRWVLEHRVTERPELHGTGYQATGELTIITSTGRSYTTRPEPLPHDPEPGGTEGDDPAPF